MSFETIRIDRDDRGVATLTLAQPEKHNAMSARMIDELTEATEVLGNDDNVRVVILTGEGKSFCAGGDLVWMQSQFNADRSTRISEALKLARMLRALNEIPKPLIGRIQGQAFGGGIGMMCVCDVSIGADHAKFALTETKLGLVPATISPYVIGRMGEAKARRVFMSARRFAGQEAVELGLLAKSVPESELDAAIEFEVEPYLSVAPGAVSIAKSLTNRLGSIINDEAMQMSAELLADCWEKPEAHEGITAFLEKKKPSWIS